MTEMNEPDPGATEDELPNQLSVVDRREAQESRYRDDLWRSNYHEAAIFIEEGMNNDKFENHPRRQQVRSQLIGDEQQGQVHNYGTLVDNNNQGTIIVNQQRGTDLRVPLNQHQPTGGQSRIINLETKLAKADSPTSSTSDTMHPDGSHSSKSSPKRLKYMQNHYNILTGQFTTIETYILVHNRYFYQLDLVASLVLIFLALFEPPAVPGFEINPTIHAAVEMFALFIIAMELLLKFRWMGPARFFKHGRTVTKILVLSTMIIEAIIIFSRQVGHARYSRALRPIFLIDNHYCNGIRRVVRQIFQAIPAIIDMFILAIFFLFVFSIFGFYLMAPENSYFSGMFTTVGNLLILTTTANMPDIIMPSYAITRWSSIYFVIFVIIHLFLLTNLTMAAVYESFTRREKEKFHKLFLHRRKACQEAFKLLVSLKHPNEIQYRQFMGLMRYLNRKYSMFEAYLIFKALDTDKSGTISLQELYQIYDYLKLDWKLIYPEVHWYDRCDCLSWRARRLIDWMYNAQNHRYFEWTIDSIIAIAALTQFLEATAFDFGKALTGQPRGYGLFMKDEMEPTPDPISSIFFISVFIIEALWRLIALGPMDYFARKWNRFDLAVLVLSLIGLISGYVGGPAFEWVIVLRVLRLVRRFEFKRRYKDLWQTLTYILLKRFVSMVCVVMILYYFFAIIGMELMYQYKLADCCKNTTSEILFRYKPPGDTKIVSSLYYLNDFRDIISSYMTLFSMTGSSFWLAIMNAYASVSKNEWLRLYFGLYYLCSIIVMNIVIAFILESFLFRIQYRNKMGDKCDDANLFTVSVSLSSEEVDFLYENLRPKRNDKNFELMARAASRISWRDDREAESKKLDLTKPTTKITTTSTSTITSTSTNNKQGRLFSGKARRGSPSECSSLLLNVNEATTTVGGGARQQRESASSDCEPEVRLARDENQDGQDEHALLLSTSHSTSGSNQDKYASVNERFRLLEMSPRSSNRNSRQEAVGSATSLADYRAGKGRFGTRCYFVYQAEQTRNKFSFTTKMYADEVENWLVEAERADMNAVDLMISRNQIRAEQVALARLLRRNLASLGLVDLNQPARGRSYSSSGGSSSQNTKTNNNGNGNSNSNTSNKTSTSGTSTNQGPPAPPPKKTAMGTTSSVSGSATNKSE